MMYLLSAHLDRAIALVTFDRHRLQIVSSSSLFAADREGGGENERERFYSVVDYCDYY